MVVIERGHDFFLDAIGAGEREQLNQVRLTFVNRESQSRGTTSEEVCRSLIDRVKLSLERRPSEIRKTCLQKLREVLYLLELEIALSHGRTSVPYLLSEIENVEPCCACGHLICVCAAASGSKRRSYKETALTEREPGIRSEAG